MNKQTITKFAAAKAEAHFSEAWRTCRHTECQRRQTCTGGPRGTCRKTNGKPLCAIANESCPQTHLFPHAMAVLDSADGKSSNSKKEPPKT